MKIKLIEYNLGPSAWVTLFSFSSGSSLYLFCHNTISRLKKRITVAIRQPLGFTGRLAKFYKDANPKSEVNFKLILYGHSNIKIALGYLNVTKKTL